MRPPAQIKPYLNSEQMRQWLRRAPNKATYQRRLVIWLTHRHRFHSRQVAQMLGVSIQSVWLWINQYNTSGPRGLQRQGRGGRRWAFLSYSQERSIVQELLNLSQNGQISTGKAAQNLIKRKFGRNVSISYVYRLLQRHDWKNLIQQRLKAVVRDRLAHLPYDAHDDFVKIARPWLRTW
jgi:transposase